MATPAAPPPSTRQMRHAERYFHANSLRSLHLPITQSRLAPLSLLQVNGLCGGKPPMRTGLLYRACALGFCSFPDPRKEGANDRYGVW